MDNFIGEIRALAFNRIPDGWVPCEGQSLNIQQNAVLYSLLGTKYGGDGVKTFNLPDLRGQAMVHFGVADSGTRYNMGKPPVGYIGTETVQLTKKMVKPHIHPYRVSNATGSLLLNEKNKGTVLFAKIPNFSALSDNVNYFIDPKSVVPGNLTPLHPGSVTEAGSSLGHENRMPYLCVQLCIATKGYYPPRRD